MHVSGLSASLSRGNCDAIISSVGLAPKVKINIFLLVVVQNQTR